MPRVHGRRRLTVHVGLAKCGSTSIQWLLSACAPLLARHGIHVPSAATRGQQGSCHNNLAWEATAHPNFRPRSGGWHALAEEIAASPAERFVVSSEVLTGPWARAPCAARLAGLAAAANLEVDVVGYVRPQWRQIESHYSQFVMTGLTAADFEVFAAELLDPGAYTRLDYGAVFAPFRAAFGPRVRVHPLEAGQPPEGLLRHFLGTLGVAPEEFPATAALPRANPRRGAMQLEVQRRFLAAAAHLGRPRSLALSRRLDALPALLDGDAPFAGLGGVGARAVMRGFEEPNAQFARDYGIGDGVLFAEPVPDGPVVRAAWASFPARQRRLVRRYVRERTGVDLTAAPPSEAAVGRRVEAAAAAEVRLRMAVRALGLAAGQPLRWWRLRGLGDRGWRRVLLRRARRGVWR